MQKPPPRPDPRLVTSPESDTGYTLFDNAALHPFVPDPPAGEGVPRVNAWWLAEASLATYWDPPAATELYASAGLHAEFVTNGSTDAYVAIAADWLVVAFRGTEPDQWQDIVTDAGLALVPARVGHVHCGFAKAVDEIWPALSVALDRLAPGRHIWFCGHSLGAALATLAADRHAATRGACTFGCPRVGDRTWAREVSTGLSGRMLRYVNNHDVVTHVPPPAFGYKHIDLARYIAGDGIVSEARPRLDHFFTSLVGHPRELPKLVASADAHDSAPAFLLDHMPKSYAIWLWNDYDAHR